MATVQPLKDIFDRPIANAMSPANVLFLATSWPTAMGPAVLGVVDATHYTTWAAVNAAAAALLPTSTAPVVVMVGPGSWTETVVLPAVGFVNYRSWGPASHTGESVKITGTLAWAGAAAAVCTMEGIRVTGTTTISGGAGTIFNTVNCLHGGNATVAGAMTANVDGSQFVGNLGGTTGCTINLVGDASVLGNVTLNASSLFVADGAISGTTTAAAGTVILATGGLFSGAISIDGTSAGDIRGSRWTSATVAAGGTLQRTTDTHATASINGTQTITFTRPYLTAPTTVTLQQLTGASPQMPLVTAITAAGFDITATAVGTYAAVMNQAG